MFDAIIAITLFASAAVIVGKLGGDATDYRPRRVEEDYLPRFVFVEAAPVLKTIGVGSGGIVAAP